MCIPGKQVKIKLHRTHFMKLIHIVFLFSVFFIAACTKNESVPDNTGIHVYNEILDKAERTDDGGFIYTSHWGNSRFFSKMDSQGKKEWSKTLQPFANDFSFSLEAFHQTADGGYVLAATAIADNIYNRYRAYLIKTDAAGNYIWSKQVDSLWTAGALKIDDVIQGKNGNYFLTGMKEDLDDSSAYLMTLDPYGALVSRKYTGYHFTRSLLYETKDTSLLICAKYLDQPLNFILKYKNGIEQGFYILNIQGQDRFANELMEDDDGGYVIGGNTDFSLSKTDFFFHKISASGSTLFSQAILDYNNNFCSAVSRTTDGGYIMIGTKSSDSATTGTNNPELSINTKIVVVKLDNNRNVKWSYVYGGNYGSQGIAVSQSPEGLLILGNQVNAGNLNTANMVAIKAKNNGQIY